MNYKIAKYGLLIVLGLLTLNRFYHLGDYSEGIAEGMAWLLFSFLFLMSFVIMAVVNLIKVRRKREKFDYFVYLFFISICCINYCELTKEGITKTKDNYITAIQKNAPRHHQMVLKNNNSFSLKEEFTEFRNFTVGNYKISHDTLILLRDDIPQKTGNNFTDKYKINRKDSLLIPLSKGFDTLKIETVQTKN